MKNFIGIVIATICLFATFSCSKETVETPNYEGDYTAEVKYISKIDDEIEADGYSSSFTIKELPGYSNIVLAGELVDDLMGTFDNEIDQFSGSIADGKLYLEPYSDTITFVWDEGEETFTEDGGYTYRPKYREEQYKATLSFNPGKFINNTLVIEFNIIAEDSPYPIECHGTVTAYGYYDSKANKNKR